MAELYPMPTSRTTIFHILTEELKMEKVNAQWVPHMLIEDYCQICMGARLEILTWYNEEGKSSLSQIVTSDGTWLHYWMPECKSTSMMWKTADEAVLRKFKEKPSAGKVLTTIFWDLKGVLLLEYCGKVLLRLLHRISTNWFACKWSLRINTPVCGSEKSFTYMITPFHTQQSSLKVCSTNWNGMFSAIWPTH